VEGTLLEMGRVWGGGYVLWNRFFGLHLVDFLIKRFIIMTRREKKEEKKDRYKIALRGLSYVCLFIYY